MNTNHEVQKVKEGRRSFLKKAAYAAPAIVALGALTPASAKRPAWAGNTSSALNPGGQ